MSTIAEKIKKDANERVLKENDGNQDFLLYLDHNSFQKGQSIDLVSKKLEIEQSTLLVFVDDEPGKNFAHRCHYLLYHADTGEFIKKVPAEFPYFLRKAPKSLELFKSSNSVDRFHRKKKMRIQLEPGKLSAYRKLAPLPLNYPFVGKRFAILFSGASNGRHVNDMEFLYRTLVDVYGFSANNIYVLNYDGTLDYNQQTWETPAEDGFGPDGSAYRLVINGAGNRADFQDVIEDLAGRIGSKDFLLIHTNNHGGWDNTKNDGYLITLGDHYYANDFGADLAGLPAFKTLLVVMEQCRSGAFSQPVIDNSPAANTVFQAAVPWNENSDGGWPFDPWAEMWISAMAGVRGDGSALAVSPDDNLNSKISAWEAYDYALSIDNPVIAESSVNLSQNVYLSISGIKPIKEVKEVKEFKEPKEIKEIKEPKEFKEKKEFKEPKEIKEIKEPKEVKEKKEYKEPKELKEGKEIKEPKEIYEGKEFYEGGEKISETIPDYDQPWQRDYYNVQQRMERLESMVSELTPFINPEQRPSLKRKIGKKNNKDNKE